MQPQELEQKVIAGLLELQQRYEQIDRILTDLTEHEYTESEMSTRLQAIATERDAIAQVQTESQAMNEAYRASRETASDQVRQISRNVAERIQQLIVKVSALESRTRGSLDRLIPEVNVNLRSVKMKNAYGSSR